MKYLNITLTDCTQSKQLNTSAIETWFLLLNAKQRHEIKDKLLPKYGDKSIDILCQIKANHKATLLHLRTVRLRQSWDIAEHSCTQIKLNSLGLTASWSKRAKLNSTTDTYTNPFVARRSGRGASKSTPIAATDQSEKSSRHEPRAKRGEVKRSEEWRHLQRGICFCLTKSQGERECEEARGVRMTRANKAEGVTGNVS